MPAHPVLLCLFALALAAASAPHVVVASPLPPPADQALARDIYAEMIAIPTTARTGTTLAAEALAARFRAAGFAAEDLVLAGPVPEKQNLVVRLRGAGRGPAIGYLTHLDVVEALPEAWTVEPFVLTERDGWFYGRGSVDTKNSVAVLAATLIRLKREGFVPRSDIVAAFTADEENGGPENGVHWLLEQRRDLFDVDYVINLDTSSILRENGAKARFGIAVAEKTYATYALTVSSPGGHSSRPVPDNAIYRLAAALTRLEHHAFPLRLNEGSRAMLEETAQRERGPLADDLRAILDGRADEATIARVSTVPFLNAVLRTTCVATMLQAGHAENALPMRARATVQCRLAPGEDAAAMPAVLAQVVVDPRVEVSVAFEPLTAPASPLEPRVLATTREVAAQLWPGLGVMPIMNTASTDSSLLRAAGIRTFDLNGFAVDVEDMRAHGRDERFSVESFYEGLEFQYRFMRALSAP
jgi:acetylornithine deacetylase/succinyl-diaminopimelate desuccinylase-like protein